MPPLNFDVVISTGLVVGRAVDTRLREAKTPVERVLAIRDGIAEASPKPTYFGGGLRVRSRNKRLVAKLDQVVPMFPRSWVAASNMDKQRPLYLKRRFKPSNPEALPKRAGKNTSYITCAGMGVIVVRPWDAAYLGAFAHEFWHRAEDRMTVLGPWANAYRDKRESEGRMFFTDYAHKRYTNCDSSEVCTTAIEAMIDQPFGSAPYPDVEHRAFVLGVLTLAAWATG